MSDRIMTIYEGKITGFLDRKDFSETKIMKLVTEGVKKSMLDIFRNRKKKPEQFGIICANHSAFRIIHDFK